MNTSYTGGWLLSKPINEQSSYEEILDSIMEDYLSFEQNIGEVVPKDLFHLSDYEQSVLIKKHLSRLYFRKHLQPMPIEEERHIKEIADKIMSRNEEHLRNFSAILSQINNDINKTITIKTWRIKILTAFKMRKNVRMEAN